MGHEMSNYSSASNYSNPVSPAVTQQAQHQSSTLTQQNFLERVDFAKSEIRSLTSNIQSIASLHQRALSSPDSSITAQLEDLVTKTQLKNTQIRDQIKFLEADALKTQDGTKGVKARQAKNLKNDFEKALKDYQEEELGYRSRYREQIARQYRIVNPEATDAEVNEASEMDWGSEGVFQTAVRFPLLSLLFLLDILFPDTGKSILLMRSTAQIEPLRPSLFRPRRRESPSQRTSTH